MNATNIQRPFGFLTWWTIHQGIYSVSTLQTTATSTGLPNSIKRLIQGAEERSGWLKATQLGATGYPVNSVKENGLRGKFLTKDLGDETRAVMYELIDRNEKRVSSRQVAILGREDREISADVEGWAIDDRILLPEIIDLIHAMQDDMDKRIGNIDDTKIRTTILRWLQDKHRVCVRGTGGVYFIPGASQELQEEILAVRSWIMQSAVGSFSTVTLRDDGATSLSDFQQSAVEEITKEIEEIFASIEKYKKSEGMNDGSRMYSSGTQVKKLDQLGEKIKVLNESLGDIQDKVNADYRIVMREARKMWLDSSQAVAVGKSESEKLDSEAGKKSGTVLDRNKKRKVA